MTRQQNPCVLCTSSLSTKSGEHIIPHWFWNSILASSQYSLEINGKPARKKNGGPMASRDTPEHVQLDCCGPCNSALNVRFEYQTGSRPAVEKAMAGVALTDEETESAGIWFLKTALLLAYPGSKSGWGVEHVSWEIHAKDPSLYTWMTTNGSPPDGLSLFMNRFTNDSQHGSEATMRLPTVVVGEQESLSQGLTFRLQDWGFALVYHPGWTFEHPNADTNNAVVQLWPPNGGVDLSSLIPHPNWPVTFAAGPVIRFASDANFPSLPPLSLGLDYDDIPGALEVLPMPESR